MQNQELRRAQEALEAARDKYADLYDFAPIGYLTVDENGQILGVLSSVRLRIQRGPNRLREAFPGVGFLQ